MKPSHILCVENEIYTIGVVPQYLTIDETGAVWRMRQFGFAKLYPSPKRCDRPMSEGGYRQIRLAGRYCYAHRLVWRYFFGPIPDGLTINHKDGVRGRNVPENLELATYSEQRKHACRVLGHDLRGALNSNAKLSEDDVRTIRKLCRVGITHPVIAAQYGIHHRHVSAIRNRRAWAWLE